MPHSLTPAHYQYDDHIEAGRVYRSVYALPLGADVLIVSKRSRGRDGMTRGFRGQRVQSKQFDPEVCMFRRRGRIIECLN